MSGDDVQLLKEKLDCLEKKIDEHNRKHEADMEEIKPFLQAASGGRILFRFFRWVAGIAVGLAALKTAFPAFSIHF